MADALTTYIRHTLPEELALALTDRLNDLENGLYAELLASSVLADLLRHQDFAGLVQKSNSDDRAWIDAFQSKLTYFISEEAKTHELGLLVIIAVAALQAFLQSNVTGPPLSFDPAIVLFPRIVQNDPKNVKCLRNALRKAMSRDGDDVYGLTPHIELLFLACSILGQPRTRVIKSSEWALMRARFIQQRTLSEISPGLQEEIFAQSVVVESALKELGQATTLIGTDRSTALERMNTFISSDDPFPAWLLEKSVIQLYYGLDKEARQSLDEAAARNKFAFALTGVLGKRTKYQQKETSQLVVLARSHIEAREVDWKDASKVDHPLSDTQQLPPALDLNDDTLLERISFTKTVDGTNSSSTSILDHNALSESLSSLDPSDQPLLAPLDSILLLSLASSITNTRPDDGLTREETLPYAQRVLESGSSNWQVYTQALLVRSRIEGYKSRTAERGLLQLQALVDQVIVETSTPVIQTNGNHSNLSEEAETSTPTIKIYDSATSDSNSKPTTFLPTVKPADTAPAHSRLQYICLLGTPFRWQLESELAARWTHVGGLRTALEIYERLELWAEVALCWAAVDREDKARQIIKRLLFRPTITDQEEIGDEEREQEVSENDPIDPPPSDAPRLYCILGDLSTTNTPPSPDEVSTALSYYSQAWKISANRYSRAQRSIARLQFQAKNYTAAALAYSASLSANQTHGPSWFALGCCLLELEAWERAAAAFRRVVGLDEHDAEGWSNLAASLVRMHEAGEGKKSSNGVDSVRSPTAAAEADDEESEIDQQDTPCYDPEKNLKAALSALRRASTLSHDSLRIYENLLTVSLSLNPPSWSDVLIAQRRIIELAGLSRGEACIDVNAVEGLAREVITSMDYTVDTQHGGQSEATPTTATATKPETTNLSEQKQTPKTLNPSITRGLPRLFLSMIDTQIIPLITTSARLWRVISRIRLWQNRPGASLDATERAWRCVFGAGGAGNNLSVNLGRDRDPSSSMTWIEGNVRAWSNVVEATMEVVDAYESLGPRFVENKNSDDREHKDEKTRMQVAADWKFKARSAIRSVLGKAKNVWDGNEDYELLKERLKELKN